MILARLAESSEHCESEPISFFLRGLYIGKYPPPGGEKISADVIWGKKYRKLKRKRGENVKEKGRKGKEK